MQFAEAANDNERLDDEGGGLLSGVNPRISLMQKLQRSEGVTQPTGGLPGMMMPGMMISTPSGEREFNLSVQNVIVMINQKSKSND